VGKSAVKVKLAVERTSKFRRERVGGKIYLHSFLSAVDGVDVKRHVLVNIPAGKPKTHFMVRVGFVP
jgi:hypothetical protein